MTEMTEKQISWFNRNLENLTKMQARQKALESKIDALKEKIIANKNKVCSEATLNTDKYSVTTTPTNTYSLTEEGFNVVLQEQGLDSPFFKHTADMKLVRDYHKYDQFIECKTGKTKVVVKYVVQG